VVLLRKAIAEPIPVASPANSVTANAKTIALSTLYLSALLGNHLEMKKPANSVSRLFQVMLLVLGAAPAGVFIAVAIHEISFLRSPSRHRW
jgi:hypothetical protein